METQANTNGTLSFTMTNPEGKSELPPPERFDWEEPIETHKETALEIASEDGTDPSKNLLTPRSGDVSGEQSPPGFGRLVGEMVVRFYEDDGLDVQFPSLGLITLGRLERALPFIYNRLHLARQMDFRQREGQPKDFVISPTDQ